jgi:hypothetical protein
LFLQEQIKGIIIIIVVRKKGGISVDHLYKWALRMEEGCMHGATPGQQGGKEAS